MKQACFLRRGLLQKGKLQGGSELEEMKAYCTALARPQSALCLGMRQLVEENTVSAEKWLGYE